MTTKNRYFRSCVVPHCWIPLMLLAAHCQQLSEGPPVSLAAEQAVMCVLISWSIYQSLIRVRYCIDNFKEISIFILDHSSCDFSTTLTHCTQAHNNKWCLVLLFASEQCDLQCCARMHSMNGGSKGCLSMSQMSRAFEVKPQLKHTQTGLNN